MSNQIEIDGYIESGEGLKPISLRVSAPVQENETAYCIVTADGILSNDKRIFGADPEQAQALAVAFLGRLLSGQAVLDSNRKQVQLPWS